MLRNVSLEAQIQSRSEDGEGPKHTEVCSSLHLSLIIAAKGKEL